MKVQSACIQCFLVLVVILGRAEPSAAQALHSERLRNGSDLVVITQPLAAATSIAWPDPAAAGASSTLTSGQLTLHVDLEEAFAGADTGAPEVVVAVGGTPPDELRAVLERLFADRRPVAPVDREHRIQVEGRIERRLGTPGSGAQLRLEVPLPKPDDPERGEAEVLWSLLPTLLAGDLEGLRSRTEGDLGLLEARTDAELAELAVRRLRIGLARIAESPRLVEDEVAVAARRLAVRRQASLERHPESSLQLLELWHQGSVAAIGEHLFGLDGVTAATVRATAARWLPRHPGNVVLTLPPRTFNPRFASPPVIQRLDSGLSVAVLERTGTPLAALCLRPVVVPDLDDETAATILSRLARELRDSRQPPAWVWVGQHPPRLEMAVSSGAFAELGEVLQSTLRQVTDDREAVLAEGGSARRRALRLMAGLLGVAEGAALSPAILLESSNLSLGVVAEDDEAAVDAISKFWAFDSARPRQATVQSLAAVQRTREAAAGLESVVVVALELPIAVDEATESVVAALIRERAARRLESATVEVLRPFVPGRKVVLVVVAAESQLVAVEELLDREWQQLLSPTSEDELHGIRRREAAETAARWSGATGRARRAASVAAGMTAWRTATDLEMSLLSVAPVEVDAILTATGGWRELPNTGSGILPIAQPAESSPSTR